VLKQDRLYHEAFGLSRGLGKSGVAGLTCVVGQESIGLARSGMFKKKAGHGVDRLVLAWAVQRAGLERPGSGCYVARS